MIFYLLPSILSLILEKLQDTRRNSVHLKEKSHLTVECGFYFKYYVLMKVILGTFTFDSAEETNPYCMTIKSPDIYI